MGWIFDLDNDFEREGFDLHSIETDQIVVRRSERLTAETILAVILTYVGGKIVDQAFEGGLESAVSKLVEFARSRDKKLRIELRESKLDPRLKLAGASIETVSTQEFKEALRMLPAVRIEMEEIIRLEEEPIQDIWYVWQDGAWRFSYYSTETGELIQDMPERRSGS